MADRTERRVPAVFQQDEIARAEALWSVRLIASNVLIRSPSTVIGEGLGPRDPALSLESGTINNLHGECFEYSTHEIIGDKAIHFFRRTRTP